MRIAYGVHGYGRGHSSRALAILPELTAHHDVLVLAGDDAYTALADEYNVVRIPVLRYVHGPDGRIVPGKTLARALPCVGDLSFHGPGVEMVSHVLEEFAPDVVVSDSEAWTHRAAKGLGLPRISFDHFGVLVWCDWPMSASQRWANRFEAMVYRRLMAGAPDRMVVVSFYKAPPKRSGVDVVGPVLRQYVRDASPTRGDYLLVYFTNGQSHFTPRIERALREAGLPTVIYGVGREGKDGNLDYRPPSNTKFVDDLAGARCAFATAGNQLISEALYLRKPLLLLPEDSLEQRLNASAIETMGVGLGTSRQGVDATTIRRLWDQADAMSQQFSDDYQDGRSAAIAAIERYARELAG